MSLKRTRIMKELKILKSNFECENFLLLNPENEINFDEIKFQVLGPIGTPLENKKFIIVVCPSDRYPLEPPSARFETPIRHPNVDEVSGRICLDLLRMPPEGSWKPNISLQSLLTSIYVLLGSPNFEDAIRPDLISEWNLDEADELKENLSTQALYVKDDSEDVKIVKRSSPTMSLSLSKLRKKAKSDPTGPQE